MKFNCQKKKDLNIRKMTNHPPSPDGTIKNRVTLSNCRDKLVSMKRARFKILIDFISNIHGITLRARCTYAQALL